MTKQTSTMIGTLLGVLIISVVVLSALGKDTEQLVTFATSAIIPTIVALWAGDKANKAKEAAQQAVTNTNGRMRELVQTIQVLGGEHMLDREKYGDLIDESPVKSDG